WGDGRVVTMALDAAGRPSAPVSAAASADPYGPEAPSTVPTPDGLDLAAAARALRAAAGSEFAHLVPDHDRDAEPDDSGVAGDASGEASARPSRAHQALFLPGGLVATTDLGHDLVRFWRADAPGLRAVQQVVLP